MSLEKSRKFIKLSPINGNNKGDLIISQCIEELLKELSIDVHSFDISFRNIDSYKKNVGKPNIRNRISFLLQTRFPWLFYQIKKMLFVFGGDFKKFESVVQSYDGVIIGGGNLLMSNMGCDYAYRTQKFLSSRYCKEGYVLCCGAGPFEFEQKKLIKNVLTFAKKVSVRDEASLKYFKSCESMVNIIPDPVFCLSDFVTQEDKQLKRYIGVNVIANYFSKSELKKFADEIITLSQSQNMDIKVINTAFPNDEQQADELVNIISNSSEVRIKVVNIGGEPQSVYDAYSDVKYFIGCRMHSIIFSLSLGIPALGFKWDDKVEGAFGEFFKYTEFKASDFTISKSHMDIVEKFSSISGLNIDEQVVSIKERIKGDLANLFSE